MVRLLNKKLYTVFMLPYKDTIHQTVIIVTKQFETNYGLFKHDVIIYNSPLQQKIDINLETRKVFLEMALLSLKYTQFFNIYENQIGIIFG